MPYFAAKISEFTVDDLKSVNYIFTESKNNLLFCSKYGAGYVKLSDFNTENKIIWILNDPVKYGIQSSEGKYWFAVSEQRLFRINSLDILKSEQKEK